MSIHNTIATLVILSFAPAGCGVVTKARECRAVSAAINPHIKAVRALSASLKPETPRVQAAKIFTEMAQKVTAGAAAVEQIGLETPELKTLGDRYLAMCAASAAAFKGMVEATHAVDSAQRLVDQGDPAGQVAMSKANAQAAQAQQAMQRATDPELEIVKGLNKVCDSE